MTRTDLPPRRVPARGRRLLAVAAAGAMLLALGACGGSSSGGGGSSAGPVTLRFAWWGNTERAAKTQKAIDAFEAANPTIKVKPEFTDFNSYFERLATSVAAGDAPDVITLGGSYPGEYGARGALLDLAKVSGTLDTADIDPSAMASGRFDGVQYGVPTGVNTYGAIADPEVFAKAGVPLPDDSTWTWEDFARISGQVAKGSPKGTFGTRDPSSPEALDMFSRQRTGQGEYTDDGKVGLTKDTLVAWWGLTTGMRDAGATPSAALTAEMITQSSPEQSLIGRGQAGLQLDWSNQLGALRQASGHDLKLLRAPGEAGAAKPGMWLQASQVYSISAKSKHQEEAAKLVGFLVNSPEAGKAILTDRGVPANATVLAAITPLLSPDQAAQAQFIASLHGKLGFATPPPKGGSELTKILQRHNSDVLFDRAKPADAAQQLIDELSAAIAK